MKLLILQNQMRTEKQMRAAALRHRIFFLALPQNILHLFSKNSILFQHRLTVF